MQDELEALLANPPSLSAVLEDRVMHKVVAFAFFVAFTPAPKMFSWHLASRFAPENMLFRDAVCDFQALCRAGDMVKARARAKSIVRTFMDPSSAFEVPTRGHVVDTENVTEQMFAPVLDHIDRDLARALQTLWTTPVFGSYLQNKEALIALNRDGEGGEQQKAPDHKADPLLTVRSAFGVSNKLLMRRHFEVGSPYTYAVFDSKDQQLQVGFCRQADDLLVFYDRDEKLLLETPAAALLGQSSLPPKTPRVSALEDDDIAGSGCFGARKSTARKSSVASDDPTRAMWMLKSPSSKELGPFAYRDLQLWWRFHLIPLTALARPLHDSKLSAITDHFPAAAQVQLIDPTALSEFGEVQM
jgi:hypothetical protein